MVSPFMVRRVGASSAGRFSELIRWGTGRFPLEHPNQTPSDFDWEVLMPLFIELFHSSAGEYIGKSQ